MAFDKARRYFNFDLWLMKLSGNDGFEVNLRFFMSDAFTKRPAKFQPIGISFSSIITINQSFLLCQLKETLP